MTRRRKPPGKRNGPEAGRPESVKLDEALRGCSVASRLTDAAHRTEDPTCWLCPLPRCGYAGCRVEVEVAS
jgi:hypothetical protein